jgi:hypothetical protein
MENTTFAPPPKNKSNPDWVYDDTPGLVVRFCLNCGHWLFADEGGPKKFKFRCPCGVWNVFPNSIQPRTCEPLCDQDDCLPAIRTFDNAD